MALTKVDTSMVESSGAFGRRNILINGDFGIYQRAQQVTGIGANASTYYTADRWKLDMGGSNSGRVTMTAGTEAAPAESNVTTSLKLDCTTADTSIGAGEYFILLQQIEGQNLQQFKKGTSGAKEFTVSFFVKGNGNATYVLELYDIDNSRQISKTFAVTSSWSKVVLTFPADTTGVFDNNANASFNVSIWLHAGSEYTGGTLNSSAWAAQTPANRAAGLSSFMSSTSNTFAITAVQLEVGSVATEFEYLSSGENLALCQRYFLSTAYPNNFKATHGVGGDEMASYNTDGYWLYQGISYYEDGQAHDMYQHPVTMRARPTPTPYAPNSLVSGYTGGSTKLAAYGQTGGGEWRAADLHTFTWAGTPNCSAFRVDYGVSDEDNAEGMWIGGFEFDAEL